jgi:hypothetical protein
MTNIVTRAGKGAPLTHAEVDGNFTNLNNDTVQFDSNGKVGIGTSTPEAKLTVAGSSTDYPWIKVVSSDTNIGGEVDIQAAYLYASNDILDINSGYYSTEGSVNKPMVFTTGPSTERVRIDSSGNVGIGTSSPSNFAGYTTLTIGGANNGEIELVSSTTKYSYLYPEGDNVVLASVSGAIRFAANDTERMRIDSSGNVGIGTASPARPLHVSDVMRLEPRNGAPSSPSKGDIYFDSADNKLKCYDGTNWQNLF